MNPIRVRTRFFGLCPISAFLLTLCFYFPGLAYANSKVSGGLLTIAPSGVAVENSGCDLEFKPSALYDSGLQSSIALHSSGLALEFHRASPFNDRIWYRVGKQFPLNKTDIVWGNSQSADANGAWPAVAISQEGYIIVVHSDREFKWGSKQYYRVGKIDPKGDENQSNSIQWDSGYHTSIAINDNLATTGQSGPSFCFLEPYVLLFALVKGLRSA
jgi:hypothetical protein